ncbi:acetyl-coenzyme A carboxylase carboxyl transferase subunit alpha, chloroplastic-like isoform X3 [Durio zibethinus]|uniref:acetyl-CoA carboxytransferase n=1 Tax=Durio zibethinus TaxID=66656 RepID=A0A6P5ZXM4_DURZI|nr:acetyl-coenzyme A carboxylase carboxyl transferase subunit alpha, chloroplastic-like isoform X3 [Durio zibethinus]
MATISLVAGNCGRRGGREDRRFEFGSNSYFGKDFLASELLNSSFRRANGYWSKALKGSRNENEKRFCVVAKVKKGKKHDYPWPDDIDPNITDGHLAYLSYFKPLDEKPKPVTLPFEKPLVGLEQKIIEVSRMADETGLDFTDQIGALENKYQQALKYLYTHLTPIQRLTIARHPNRPTALDHILNITEKWVELHGDRAGYDDPAIVTGIGSMDGKSYMFIGHQKGRNTKENIFRNFAMPTPHGPEACAAILYKSSEAAPKAAERLRITAKEHYKRKIADGIIREPLGGAHADPVWTSQQIKLAITRAMEELTKMNTEELLHHRMLKFRSIERFPEGKRPKPVEPEKKRNMKPSDASMLKAADIESDLERLKKNIVEAKVPSDPTTDQAIEKLKQDVDKEVTRAFISMGFQKKLESLKLELSRAPDNQPLNHNLKVKVDKLMKEFMQNLSRPGAYLGLKQKLENLSMVSRLIERKEKGEKLKTEINQKIPAEVKAKLEQLKNAQKNLSKGDPLDEDLVAEAVKVKKELMEVLKSANLEIVGVTNRKVPELQQKIVNVNKEIGGEIERIINVSGLRGKIEELKAEMAKGSSSPRVEKLETEIKERILAALDNTALKDKFENLRREFAPSFEAATDKRLPAEKG